MCKCFKCEMLMTDEPIKVIDFKAKSPFADDIYHFESGFKCIYNGSESLAVEKLPEKGCRCTGGK